MSRKIVLATLILGLVALAFFLGYSTINRINAKSMAAEKLQTAPVGNFYSMDSILVKIPNKNFALIYFDSGCEHCQNELKEVSSNRQLFVDKQLVFVSSENISSIKKVALEYRLNTEPTFYFYKIEQDDVFDTFGSTSLPHIFIYGLDGRLVKEFKGETNVATIAHYLPLASGE